MGLNREWDLGILALAPPSRPGAPTREMLPTADRIRRVVPLLLFDAVLLSVAWVLSYQLRFAFSVPADYPDGPYRDQMLMMLPWVLVLHLAAFLGLRLYRGLPRYVSTPELTAVVLGCLAATAFWGLFNLFVQARATFLQMPVMQVADGEWRVMRIPFSVLGIYFFTSLTFVGGLRFSRRLWDESRQRAESGGKPTLLVGAGDLAEGALRELQRSQRDRFRPLCAVATGAGRLGASIHGIRVEGVLEDIPALLDRHRIESVLIALDEDDPAVLRQVVRLCHDARVETCIIPTLRDLASGRVEVRPLRPVRLEDLLAREPALLSLGEGTAVFRNETILITGAGGSIGSELARQVAQCKPARLILVGKGENSIHAIATELAMERPGLEVVPRIVDVRDRHAMERLFADHEPAVVFHAAAHKHVPLMEEQPGEAVKTNVVGTATVAWLAHAHGAKRFILVSSDKAVHPASVMGATKRVAERVVFSLANESDTAFSAVRFGNVLGSRGSAIEIFQRQIEKGGPVTVTHPEAERYFMTLRESASLVLHAAVDGRTGCLYLLDMGRPVKIVDLVHNLITLSGLRVGTDIEIEFIGLRPGDKIREESPIAHEGAQPTRVPKLHVARPGEMLTWERASFCVAELKELANADSPAPLLEYLRSLVHDFHHHALPELDDAEAISERVDAATAALEGQSPIALAAIEAAASGGVLEETEDEQPQSTESLDALVKPRDFEIPPPASPEEEEPEAASEDDPVEESSAQPDAPEEVEDIPPQPDEDIPMRRGTDSLEELVKPRDFELAGDDEPHDAAEAAATPDVDDVPDVDDPSAEEDDSVPTSERPPAEELSWEQPSLFPEADTGEEEPLPTPATDEAPADVAISAGDVGEASEPEREEPPRTDAQRPDAGLDSEDSGEALTPAAIGGEESLPPAEEPPAPTEVPPHERRAEEPESSGQPPAPPPAAVSAGIWFRAGEIIEKEPRAPRATNPPGAAALPHEKEASMTQAGTKQANPCVFFAHVEGASDKQTSELVEHLHEVGGGTSPIVMIGAAKKPAVDAATADLITLLPDSIKGEATRWNTALESCPAGAVLVSAAPDIRFVSDFAARVAEAIKKTPDAQLFYSDHIIEKDGKEELVKTHDHEGCPHERFEFGRVMGYVADAVRAAGGFDESLQHAWEYDMHLKLMEKGPIQRIPHPCYRVIEVTAADSQSGALYSPGKGPLGGFSYVFYPEDVEREVTTVFEKALKRWGAWLDHPTVEVPQPKQKPEVLATVVIPVLNRVKYIGNAIEKIVNGTFSDFEVVVVDNGSTDGTIDVVKEWSEKDKRIRLLHGKGSSIASALNEGIRAARGKYICQLDSDDQYDRTTLEKMVGHLESHPKCGLAISYYRLMDENAQVIDDVDPITHSGYTRNQILRRDGAGALRVFPKAVLEEFGYYDEENYGNFGEDYDMVLKTGEKYDVDRVHEVLYYYRRHADNTDVIRAPEMKYRNKNHARQQALRRRIRINRERAAQKA